MNLFAVKKFWHNSLDLEKLTVLFLSLTVFSLPFPIKTVLFELPVFTSGQFNPFTSFSLYLSDLFLLISLILFGLQLFKTPSRKITWGSSYLKTFIFLILILSELLIFFTTEPIVSLLKSLRLIEILVFYLLILNQSNHFKTLIKTFIGSACFQSVIAFFQYLKQSSLKLYFLGEPEIGPDIPGVAKIDLSADKIIRSYGTLPHPNILGGILTVSIFLTIMLLPKKKKIYLPLLILQLVGLLLTFSRSAILGLVIGLIIWFIISKKPLLNIRSTLITLVVIGGIITAFALTPLSQRIFTNTKETALAERFELLTISKNMFLAQPYGVGLGQFTLNIQAADTAKILPWEYQPVHNCFLLILNELGPLGLILIVWILVKITRQMLNWQKKLLTAKKKRIIGLIFGLFVSIFIIINLDHYFYSLYQGQMLLGMILSLLYYSKIIAKTEVRTIKK